MTQVACSPLIERTVSRLRRELASGRFQPDAPLPTHRQWAQRLKVSHFIVGRAMEILKQEGVVESQEGSYTYLMSVPPAAPAKSPAATVHVWDCGRRDLRKLRQGIVRARFHQQFRRQNPGIQVSERSLDVAIQEFEATLIESLLAGAEPTLGRTRQTYLPLLVEQAGITAFDPSLVADHVAQLAPACVATCTRGGRLVMLPTNWSASLMIYSPARLAAAELDAHRPPQDWGELFDYCLRLSQLDGGRPSLHVLSVGDLVWWLMQLTYQCLPGTRDATLSGVDWNSAAARKAVEFVVKLCAQGLLKVHECSGVEVASAMLAGHIPLLVDSGAVASQIALLGEAGRLPIALLPRGPNGQPLSLLNCGGWVLNAHASAAEQDAATRYAMEWEQWLTAEGGTEMERLGVSASLLPVRRAGDRRSLPAAWCDTIEQLMDYGRWEPAQADWEKSVLSHGLETVVRPGQPVLAEQLVQQLRLQKLETSLGHSAPGVERS